jgi:hypothetical protein
MPAGRPSPRDEGDTGPYIVPGAIPPGRAARASAEEPQNPRSDEMRRAVIMLLLVGSFAPAPAETVTIEATRDATLIEHPAGALANGKGASLFVGRTAQSQNGARRAVLHFDLDGVVPHKALIESATLTLTMTPSHEEPRLLALHRVLADWGEGPSSSSGGGGASSLPGDVTWVHTFLDSEYWVHGGGQFVAHPSAVLEVGGPGSYTWDDPQGLLPDVRLWSSAPHRNFGWILIGDETLPQTVKSFASREDLDSQLRPVLQITYREPGKP